jgi:thiol:disulfide interchange protein DsbC
MKVSEKMSGPAQEGAAMKKYLIMLILLASVVYVSPVFAFGGCEEICQKCHSLTKQEVQQIFEKLQAPEAKVVDIKMSQIKGLWEVALDNNGQAGIMYVGFSKKYIMGGPIFEIETAMNKSQESLQKTGKEVQRYVDLSTVPLDNALLLGEKAARYKVIVFTDPECPYCSKLHSELKKVIAESRDVAFYLKLVALPMHPDAHWKSESILCSKSLQLLEDNFEQKAIPKPACETKAVDDNISLAKTLDITGTPTLIMPDGMVVIGSRDAKTIIEMAEHPQKKEE